VSFSRERLYWTLGAAVVLVTWSTLKWARVAADWLRASGVVDQAMWSIFAVAGGALTRHELFDCRFGWIV
jgi:hypothetical protein